MQLLPNGQTVASLYFQYTPNLPACYVAIAVFAILFLVLLTRCFMTPGGSKLALLLPFTALLELVGFILRDVTANNPTTDIYTAMSVFLLVSSNILAILNYLIVEKVIKSSNLETRYLVIGPKFAKLFFRSNVITMILQIVGGSIQSGSQQGQTAGPYLVIAGIAFQLAVFLVFFACALYVDRCDDYNLSIDGRSTKHKVFKIVYATHFLLFVRNLYRMVEYIIVRNNPSQAHEWSFYVFDALLNAICMAIYAIFFIGRDLPKENELITSSRRGEDVSNEEPKDYEAV